jgi:regulator of protease activity HflC (stomatin/prohibitin superfamily)
MPSEPDDAATPDEPEPTTKPKVTWRGIVDAPIDAPTGRKEKVMSQLSTMGTGDGLTRRRKRTLLIAGLVVVVGVLVLASAHIVSAGNVTVPVTFGSAQAPIGEGLHFTAPFPITSTNDMSIQTQNYTMTAADLPDTDDPVLVLGLDGAGASVQATLLFALDPARASDVFRDIGTDYSVTLVQPTARSCIRSEFANHTIVDAATSALGAVTDEVRSCIAEKIEPRGISLQDLQIREVTLTDQVQGAVNDKAAAQQAIQTKQFELLQAVLLAQITRTNAAGTADAQQILACGSTTRQEVVDGNTVEVFVPNTNENCNPAQLTPEVLQYNYIQMLREVLQGDGNTIILSNDSVAGAGGVNPVVNVGPATTTP